MKKILLLTALALAVSVPAAHAAMIEGKIDFGGLTQFNGNTAPGSASSVISWGNPFVLDASGDFSSIPSLADGVITPVNIVAPWSFNSGLIENFWSVGGFSFDLLASSVSIQTESGVIVTGNGVLRAPGFDDTTAAWYFSAQGTQGSRFSFSANSEAVATAVPEGGMTAALLGMSLLVLGAIARRRATPVAC